MILKINPQTGTAQIDGMSCNLNAMQAFALLAGAKLRGTEVDYSSFDGVGYEIDNDGQITYVIVEIGG